MSWFNPTAKIRANAIARVNAARATGTKPSPPNNRKALQGITRARVIPARAASKQRIRYVETPGEMIAILQKRSLFGKWVDTQTREVIDKARAMAAMKAHDARTGNTAGFGDGWDGAAFDDTAGFGDRFKRFVKKVAKNKVVSKVIKAHTVPLKIAHKVTHGKNSPIRKLEMKVQKFVGKNLPITKPFINFHNKVSAKLTNTALERVGIAEEKKKATAKAIVKATKKIKDPKARAATQKELAKRAKQYVVDSPMGGTFRFDPSEL